jgi:hypothetical protein
MGNYAVEGQIMRRYRPPGSGCDDRTILSGLLPLEKLFIWLNHKDEVSKTTTAFNLGWVLGLMGKQALLADFDG